MSKQKYLSSLRMKTYIYILVLFIDCLIAENSGGLTFEGDTCEMGDKRPGVCVRLSLCFSAQEMLKTNIHPINCGFIQNIPLVCCLKRETDHTFLAEKKCAFYSIPVFAIILGKDVKKGEFPHMAALGYNQNNKKVWLCGGTLISENFVLTAAHCLYSQNSGPVKWVRLGVVDINTPEDDDIYEVNKTIVHPLYKPPLVYHDIGLIQFKGFLNSFLFIRPACLHTKDFIPADTELLAAGWGLTKVGGNQSAILQKTTLDLFTEEECDLNYNSTALKRRLKHGIQHEQQLCAGGRNIGTDTCQGDSGGPLVFEIDQRVIKIFHVVGITSFGKSCGYENVPGVYVRVSYYLSWIESIVWPDEM